MPQYVLSADLGATNIRVARVSSTGRISYLTHVPTPAAGGTAVVEALARLLGEIPRQGVRGIGVDVPGLAYEDGDVWAPNIRGWKRMPLGRLLRNKMGLPVVVDSDRNAFVMGEAWKGVARNCSNVVFLAVGTGIGAGILVDGRLLRGSGELAGCLGWMAVSNQYLPQYRKVGCLESHVAGPGIGLAASRKLGRRVSAEETTRLATEGNLRAREVLSDTGAFLGLALANLVSTLNPEMIVIGGGVAEGGTLLLKKARQTMMRWGQPIAVHQVRLKLSQLGNAASLLGAARLAFEGIRRA
jgi:glucokinase